MLRYTKEIFTPNELQTGTQTNLICIGVAHPYTTGRILSSFLPLFFLTKRNIKRIPVWLGWKFILTKNTCSDSVFCFNYSDHLYTHSLSTTWIYTLETIGLSSGICHCHWYSGGGKQRADKFLQDRFGGPCVCKRRGPFSILSRKWRQR